MFHILQQNRNEHYLNCLEFKQLKWKYCMKSKDSKPLVDIVYCLGKHAFVFSSLQLKTRNLLNSRVMVEEDGQDGEV